MQPSDCSHELYRSDEKSVQLVQEQRTEVWPLLEDSKEDASIIMENSVGITVKQLKKKPMQNCFDVFFDFKKERVGNTCSFV